MLLLGVVLVGTLVCHCCNNEVLIDNSGYLSSSEKVNDTTLGTVSIEGVRVLDFIQVPTTSTDVVRFLKAFDGDRQC